MTKIWGRIGFPREPDVLGTGESADAMSTSELIS